MSNESANSPMREQSRIQQWIDALGQEKAWQALSAHQASVRFFDIVGISHWENQHSLFLTWLLDTNGTHGMGDLPMRLFLRCVCNELLNGRGQERLRQAGPDLTELARVLLTSSFDIKLQAMESERPLSEGRADIYAEMTIREHRAGTTHFVRLIIENKVTANEHDGQTTKYFNHCRAMGVPVAASDLPSTCRHVVGVFLTPIAEQQPACPEFVRLSYQALLNDVLLQIKPTNTAAAMLCEQYRRTLRYSSARDAISTMAIPYAEMQELRDVWHRHKPLFQAIIDALKRERDDQSVSEEDPRNEDQLVSFRAAHRHELRMLTGAAMHDSPPWEPSPKELDELLVPVPLVQGIKARIAEVGWTDDWQVSAGTTDRALQVYYAPFCDWLAERQSTAHLKNLHFYVGAEGGKLPYVELRFAGGGLPQARKDGFGDCVEAIRNTLVPAMSLVHGKVLESLYLCRRRFRRHEAPQEQVEASLKFMKVVTPIVEAWFHDIKLGDGSPCLPVSGTTRPEN